MRHYIKIQANADSPRFSSLVESTLQVALDGEMIAAADGCDYVRCRTEDELQAIGLCLDLTIKRLRAMGIHAQIVAELVEMEYPPLAHHQHSTREQVIRCPAGMHVH